MCRGRVTVRACMAFILLIRALYHRRYREDIYKMLLKMSYIHMFKGGKSEKGRKLWEAAKGVAGQVRPLKTYGSVHFDTKWPFRRKLHNNLTIDNHLSWNCTQCSEIFTFHLINLWHDSPLPQTRIIKINLHTICAFQFLHFWRQGGKKSTTMDAWI